MWPSIRSGSRVTLRGVETVPAPGSVVVVAIEGTPDIYRLVRQEPDGIVVKADAEPGVNLRLSPEEFIGEVDLVRKNISEWQRRMARTSLDLLEALIGELAEDQAASVQVKYSYQAPFYQRSGAQDLSRSLADRLERFAGEHRRILVVGCGTGRECFGLSSQGWNVLGIDFSPEMIEIASEARKQRGLEVSFRVADLRELDLGKTSLDAVLFTYDVYSFLPCRKSRIKVLRRMGEWLRPRGGIFISARRLKSVYDRAVLTLQRARHGPHGAEWGDSHTRWIDRLGQLHRSYVHVFSDSRLRNEVHAAGMTFVESWQDGHAVIRPAGT